MELINGLLTLGFNLISIFFTIVLALVAAFVAWTKGRNPLIWGFGTLFFPWMILVVFFLPRKVPRFTSYLKKDPAFQGKNPVIASIMALSAIIAKADGHVSKEEVALIKRFITSNFQISGSELAAYQDAFEYGKAHPEEYKEFVRVIKLYYSHRNFVLSLSYLFLTLGHSETNTSTEGEDQIKLIIMELGLSEYEYISIKRYFASMANGGQQGYYSGGFQGGYQRGYQGQNQGNGFVNQEALVDKYSKVLGVDKSADMTEIKKAYRKLAKEYHPDKMAQDGMPEEYTAFANQRISEINEAYEFMKKRAS